MEISAAELAETLGTADAPFVLDVREPDECAEWPMPGAINIPLGALRERVDEVPVDRDVVVMCARGNRSARAADLLGLAGIEARSLEGGIVAWGSLYDEAETASGSATVVQIRRRGKGCLSYLIGAGDEAVVIDPSMATEVYVDAARRRGWRITLVTDTHLHADHLSGAHSLATLTGARLALNPADAFHFDFTPLHDREVIRVGDAELAVTATETPGHTNGSTTFALNGDVAFTGDTLFVDGVGRPDLAEKAEVFAHALYHSLHERIVPLGPAARVMPAHFGQGVTVRPGEVVCATVGELFDTVEPLRLDESGFVAWAVARTSDRPPNYIRIITANIDQNPAELALLQDIENGPNRCSA